MIINGTSGRDNFFGSEGDDTIRGGSGGDTLAGGGGNDLIIGGDEGAVYHYVLTDVTGTASLVGGFSFDPVTNSYYQVGITGYANIGSDSWSAASGTESYLVGIGGSYASLYIGFSSPLGSDSLVVGISWAASSSYGGWSGSGTASLDIARIGDSISGGGGDDIIRGLMGWDQLQGDAGNDSLFGGDGRDTLNGGAGADVLSGGPGDDFYVFESDLDTIVESISGGFDTVRSAVMTTSLPMNVERLILTGNAAAGFGNALSNSIEGNDASNRLYGLLGNDVLIGGSGNDTLAGAAGNDSLDGGSGVDVLKGGSGDDTYYVTAGDTLAEAIAEGYDTVISSNSSMTLPLNVEHLILANGAIDGFGNGLANLLEGNGSNNQLAGGDGDDHVYGFDGDDLLAGGSGSDTLMGGNGNDSLNGASGSDLLVGEAGDDSYSVNATGDVIVELPGQGFDTVSSTVSYTLAADLETLHLIGAGNISGVGNAESNAVTGNSGNNLLSGGDGSDTLTGGAGADRFLFDVALSAVTNLDAVTDFEVGADKLRLDGSIFDALASGIPLAESQFLSGAGVVSARTATQIIIYDTSTGALYYDVDGVGGVVPVQFAQMGAATHPALSAGDFVIVT